ncbi:murein L,D-transpeptidase [Ketobacter sp.]|uniref:L,D-transpeptidase family protein n=1 Tax=Ketobacter sp. TaxID=2083498 RepID=UPI0025B9AE45|nr:L,D-transpeptidase family protein [Ketobacter sp.]
MSWVRWLLCGVGLAVVSARADTSVELRQYLESLDAGSPAIVADQRLLAAKELQRFYRQRQHQAVWVDNEVSEQLVADLIAAIESSGQHGFLPDNYHLALLQREGLHPLARELLATDAFLAQARHRQNGVLDPKTIDPEWSLSRETRDPVGLLNEALAQGQIQATLNGLWPIHQEYQALLDKRAQLLAMQDTETAEVPPGPALKPGMQGERVTLLKQRLLGPGEYSDAFDATLEASVRAFQAAAGLDVDGVVGAATLERLNASHFSWIDRVDANLERWRWLPDVLPETYLRVNIAAFSLRAIRNNKDDYRMNVIVGKPFRRTPVFSESMKYFVYNPYWNVPPSIATKDKLPLLRKDAGALESIGYEVKVPHQSQFIGVSQVDWTGVTPRNFNYVLRQQPGPKNALGSLKFMLPNPYAVYLHDTPDHNLFQKQERGFSSGCVRLSDPLGLAYWVLNTDGQSQSRQDIQQQIDSRETRTVYLKKPIPVYIVYLTAFVDENGEVVFRRDLYQRDQPIVRQLRQEF